MPRRVVKRPWVGRGHPLHGDEQGTDLMQGRRGGFASEAERRAAWTAQRDRLIASIKPCTRPQAWWDYESKIPRDPHRSQDEQLYVLSVLTSAERAQFEASCARMHRDVDTLPPAGFGALDPRTALRWRA